MTEELAPWRTILQRALHRNRSNAFSRYFQIATIDIEGKPRNRTVVFRGFVDDSNSIKIVTDTRSEKFEHLQKNPHAEICWYFTKSREQFRLQGTVDLICVDDEANQQLRQQAWEKLSNNAQEQFYWAYPAKPVTDTFFTAKPFQESSSPIDNFCLLIFQPIQVDHLELKGDPQNRFIYSLNDDRTWSKGEVNP